MRLILQETIEKLGVAGQVVEVKSGYARNYLLPRGLAIPATDNNLRRLEKIKSAWAKRESAERESATQLAEVLNAVSLSMARKAGENDQLFGSVTAADITEALAAQGYKVEKRRVQLDEPIKVIGEYTVPIKLYSDITATVKVTV
ncbi:MAG TPA: 50S ribosomal protein L9, partial [Candidatus Acidoferrales bacterium]